MRRPSTRINCLRKHCSAVKGGQLARAAAPATLLTLVLSDVVGSPLDVIGSGPPCPDASTWADRLGPSWSATRWRTHCRIAIVAQSAPGWRATCRIRPSRTIRRSPAAGPSSLRDNRVAAPGCVAKARESEFNAQLLTTFIQGEAAQIAKVAVALSARFRSSGIPVAAPACLILGGETTVTLGDNPGRGGRNQELALDAALELEDSIGITVVSLATDGTDGPTDSGRHGRRRHCGPVARPCLDAADHLRRHDAYLFLAATGDLLIDRPDADQCERFDFSCLWR